MCAYVRCYKMEEKKGELQWIRGKGEGEGGRGDVGRGTPKWEWKRGLASD